MSMPLTGHSGHRQAGKYMLGSRTQQRQATYLLQMGINRVSVLHRDLPSQRQANSLVRLLVGRTSAGVISARSL